MVGAKGFNFYKLLLLKAYFDKGFGLTSYFKYAFAFGGIFNFIDGKTAIIIALVYIALCFILGYLWFKYKLIDVENDIQNQYNPFQREVRRKLKLFQ